MLESLFHKVADLHACYFIKMSSQHRCFPVARNFCETPILKNICVRLHRTKILVSNISVEFKPEL